VAGKTFVNYHMKSSKL